MIKGAMVVRLEALLERVRARAGEPRRGEAKAQESDVLEAIGHRASASPATSSEPADVGWANVEDDTVARRPGSAADEPARDDHDSGQRLVAADAVANEERAARSEESAPPADLANVEVASGGGREEDEREEPPASSRRPVAPQPEDQLAHMAFGTEDPPHALHTPPPESGKLPSAPQTEFDQEAEFGEVHSPTPLLPRRMTEGAGPRGLVPEAMRPQLVPSDVVAEVIVAAERFAPPTFVALLDASLGL